MRAAGSSSGAAGSSAAHAASGAAALSERERMYSALQFNENWAKLRIKYDPRHWMGNWFLMAASKTSPLFKYFCCATADAMFKVCEGERERVKAHLRILFAQGEGADERERVDARIRRISRRYWKRMCRWEIGAPQELARELLHVYDFFKDLPDPSTGRPFFAPDHAKRCAHELSYVAAGYLSDRPDIPLYLHLFRAHV